MDITLAPTKREKILLKAIFSLQLIQTTIGPELIKDVLRRYRRQVDKDINTDFGVLGILTLHPSQVSESLFDKLFDENYNIYKYEDVDGMEHLFGVNVHEHLEEAGIDLSMAELKELTKLRKRMDDGDCGYFRFIV